MNKIYTIAGYFAVATAIFVVVYVIIALAASS
jgi:hypothetical protein